jgi:GNAT superfamily N-acetyltransferase
MRISVTRTYLELASPADLDRATATPPEGTAVVRRESVSAARFRELYAGVGENYHWRDRDAWSDAEVEDRFSGSRVTIWELTIAGALAGFYELEQHDDGSIEIVLFGLLAPFAGLGLGKWLLVDAAERAWSLGATRVWLHTCTLDSPAALPNYLARGFRPYRTERYEIEPAGMRSTGEA